MINSLKNVKGINGKPICVMDDLKEKFPEKFNESGEVDSEWFESEIRPNFNFNIFLRHDVDSLTFNILTKPANEGGDLNRCQAVDLIITGLEMFKYYNKVKPCGENAATISLLEASLVWQERRNQRKIEEIFDNISSCIFKNDHFLTA